MHFTERPLIFVRSVTERPPFWQNLSLKDPYIWGAWWHSYITFICECPPTPGENWHWIRAGKIMIVNVNLMSCENIDNLMSGAGRYIGLNQLFWNLKPIMEPVAVAMDSDVATRGPWGGRVPPLTAKNLPKIREKREKSGKIGKKEEKIGKKRQKSGSFFHFAPPDR